MRRRPGFTAAVLADRGPSSAWRRGLREAMLLARVESTWPPRFVRRVVATWRATGSVAETARALGLSHAAASRALARLGERTPGRCPQRAPKHR